MLNGCGGLPAAAPTKFELTADHSEAGINYSVVNIDARVAGILNRYRATFGEEFRNARYRPDNSVLVGDAIAITVYESGGSNLFPPPSVVPGAPAITTSGSVATGASNVPPQIVETDGTIYVPFVGRLKVRGLNPGQIGKLIERELEGKAVAPQVLVTIVNAVGNSATVSGEVGSARLVPLSSRGEHLLDVIAAAGGARYPAYETYVQVIRGNRTGKVLLQTILSDPKENIIVRPRDQVYLSRNPRTFAVLGATQRVSLYPFPNEKVSLAEAIATAGGPTDPTGDPSGIYLFRFEVWPIAREILTPEALASYGDSPPEFVPIVYQANLLDANGYFLSQAVQMRDKDVVLITNATATQLQKLLVLVRGVSGVAFDAASIRVLTR